jgi:hypothetical protein
MKKDNIFLLLVFLLIGLVFGGIIGDYLSQYIEILNYSKSIGISDFKMDLSIISLTFGFKMNLSLASVLGLFLSIILYRKL